MPILPIKKHNARFPVKRNAGFTLVEMLVSIAIFSSIVTLISTIFASSVRLQRQGLAYQELLDQTSYLMERLSRTLRMAMKDDIMVRGFLPKNCLSGDKVNYEFSGNCLKFRSEENECKQFCLQSAGSKKKIVEITEGGTPIDLTSPNLNVKTFNVKDPNFTSWQQPPTDYFQPMVQIYLEIEGREQSKIQIETSVSQRNLDIQR